MTTPKPQTAVMNQSSWAAKTRELSYKLYRHKSSQRCNDCRYGTACPVVTDLVDQLKGWQTKVLARDFK